MMVLVGISLIDLLTGPITHSMYVRLISSPGTIDLVAYTCCTMVSESNQ